MHIYREVKKMIALFAKDRFDRVAFVTELNSKEPEYVKNFLVTNELKFDELEFFVFDDNTDKTQSNVIEEYLRPLMLLQYIETCRKQNDLDALDSGESLEDKGVYQLVLQSIHRITALKMFTEFLMKDQVIEHKQILQDFIIFYEAFIQALNNYELNQLKEEIVLYIQAISKQVESLNIINESILEKETEKGFENLKGELFKELRETYGVTDDS